MEQVLPLVQISPGRLWLARTGDEKVLENLRASLLLDTTNSAANVPLAKSNMWLVLKSFTSPYDPMRTKTLRSTITTRQINEHSSKYELVRSPSQTSWHPESEIFRWKPLEGGRNAV
ncbi:hypothetical protein PoB_005998600 [Plakobranchus ocellatus]|uniref:Uncharacterized protein n=1 Tax=Plakobranchus ocellatus TaxID=259542 RepID=A0AAV4CNP5_9GAST|nr:hypothetical protein PoB_005998600 [Plakobranchus ocellatus]